MTLTAKERLLKAATGKSVDRPPVWIMRQAGRYDPDYLAIREKYSFHDLCTIPEVCAEASFLPMKNLGVDALIIFNDILTPLKSMGLEVDFPDSGPEIKNPLRAHSDLDRFESVGFEQPPVTENLKALRALAGNDMPLLGFAGAPFTLLSYAVEGRMSRNQHFIKDLIFRHPDLAQQFMDRLVNTVVTYLAAQVREGTADMVQLFESQAPALSIPDYTRLALPYVKKVIQGFKALHPTIPLVLYARGSRSILHLMADSGADVVSIDWTHTLSEARALHPQVSLQGNLDPTVLLVPEAVPAAVERMLDGFDYSRGYIANLGHGIIPQAQVAGARSFVKAIQSLPSVNS